MSNEQLVSTIVETHPGDALHIIFRRNLQTGVQIMVSGVFYDVDYHPVKEGSVLLHLINPLWSFRDKFGQGLTVPPETVDVTDQEDCYITIDPQIEMIYTI